jgi:hypothetical protein
MSRQDQNEINILKRQLITTIMNTNNPKVLQDMLEYQNILKSPQRAAHNSPNAVKKETEINVPPNAALNVPSNSRDPAKLNPFIRNKHTDIKIPITLAKTKSLSKPKKDNEKEVKTEGGSKKNSLMKRNGNNKNSKHSRSMQSNIWNQYAKTINANTAKRSTYMVTLGK